MSCSFSRVQSYDKSATYHWIMLTENSTKLIFFKTRNHARTEPVAYLVREILLPGQKKFFSWSEKKFSLTGADLADNAEGGAYSTKFACNDSGQLFHATTLFSCFMQRLYSIVSCNDSIQLVPSPFLRNLSLSSFNHKFWSFLKKNGDSGAISRKKVDF